MESKERPTMLERLLEMVRERGGTATETTGIGSRQVEPNRPRNTKKKVRKERGSHQSAECADSALGTNTAVEEQS